MKFNVLKNIPEQEKRITVSTLITLVRIVLIPFIVQAILYGNWWRAFVLFAVASVSDALDGHVARWYGQETLLGAFLDTAADKVLFLSVVVSLALLPNSPYPIPLWFVLFFVAREAAISIGSVVLFFLRRGVTIRPVFISKCAGFVRSLFVALLLLAYFVACVPCVALQTTFYLTVFLELLACAHYAMIAVRWLMRK